MPWYRRNMVPGGTFFFTVVTYDRRPLFHEELARICLREAWTQTAERLPFTCDAICLLPEHLHCIWTLPHLDTDYSARWRELKGTFSKLYLARGGEDGPRCASRKRKREAALWQRRFWEHTIRDQEDLEAHFHYVHFNPVKHRHVAGVKDWPWSTFHRYVQLGYYEPDWGETEPPGLDGISQDCE